MSPVLENKTDCFMSGENIYDCIIIGAGPGGLQAAIYLGRFNRDALLIDRGGGRTAHAKSIENFLTQRAISGKQIIELGMEQAESFNVRIAKEIVTSVIKKEHFEVHAGDASFHSKFVIVSSGVQDNFPPIENFHKFLGTSFFTCVDCDGHKTTGKKLVIIGNTINSVRLAFGMRDMYTDDIALILYFYDPPDDYKEELQHEGIQLIKGEPIRIIGDEHIEAVELKNGTRIPCESIMSNFGYKLNDKFLKDLNLKRDAKGFKYVVNSTYESSLNGLYIVGPLNTGNDQVVIAAGEGAVAAIDINKRLLEI
jgi:thioredoxin reductase (NADPH)